MSALDVDPRTIALRELTFAEDPATAMLMRGAVLPSTGGRAPTGWRSAAPATFCSTPCCGAMPAGARAVTGGLAPADPAPIAELIEARLARP